MSETDVRTLHRRAGGRPPGRGDADHAGQRHGDRQGRETRTDRASHGAAQPSPCGLASWSQVLARIDAAP